jgi:RNA polymerase sigma-70 factor (ECF subfamily)
MTERENFLRNAMEAHGDTVYRLALCRLQNQTDAEDVYQDVFLRLLEQSDRDWDGEHLKAWLIRATLNRCADLGRFRLRRPVLSLEELPELTGPVDDQSARLWEAVARLPEKLRTVVHLYYAEGYKTEEIAAMLGIPAATVRTRLRRGREKLKDLLGGIDDEEPLSRVDGRNSCARGAQ